MNRRVPVAGAFLGALCVLGLWVLLEDKPSPAVKQARPSATPVASASAPRAVAPPREEVKPEGALAVELLAGNSPVPGAQVQVYWREAQDSPAPPPPWSLVDGGETNGSGHWEAPARPGSYFISARAEGFAPGTVGVLHPPGGERTAVRLRLEAKVGLLGHTVMWGTGEPISFAEIILTPLAFPPGQPGHLDAPEEELLSTTSNEAGEFSFTGLAPGRYRTEARAPGFVRKVLPSVPVPFGARVTFALAPGGRIEGAVIGKDGQPIAGAEVLAFSSSQDATVFTDAEGGFSFELPAGRYSVSARHELEAGALDRELTLAVEQVVRGLRLRLGDGARISGQVLWEDGTAALGARVEARVRGARVPSGEVGTDEKGAFSLPSLAAGTYDVAVAMPQGGRLDHPGLALASGEHATLTFTYKRRGSLHVRVKDRRAQPVPGARVQVWALQVPEVAPGLVHEGQTDAQGVLHLADLKPGQYQVEARRGPGAESSAQAVTVSESAQREVLLWVPGPEDAPALTSIVEGRVVQRSGAALDGLVRIDVFTKGYNPLPLQTALADAQGRFRLELSPGSYSLSAQRQHRLLCEPPSYVFSLELEANQPTQATLVLEEPLKPAMRIRVQEADGGPSRLTPVVAVHRAGTQSGQTDASGQLELCMPPGHSGFPLRIQALEPRRDGLVMQPGMQQELTVRLLPRPTLRGRLTHLGGPPVKGFHLELRDTHSPLSVIANDFVGDQFELREVPIGQSQLAVTVDDGRRAMMHIDTSSGAAMSLEVPVHSGVPLTGRVVHPTTGAPLAEAEVFIRSFAHTRTGRDGRFTLQDLPAGEHLLQIDRAPMHLSRTVTLEPGQGQDLGDIVLPPP